jgi:hypothetical protein
MRNSRRVNFGLERVIIVDLHLSLQKKPFDLEIFFCLSTAPGIWRKGSQSARVATFRRERRGKMPWEIWSAFFEEKPFISWKTDSTLIVFVHYEDMASTPRTTRPSKSIRQLFERHCLFPVTALHSFSLHAPSLCTSAQLTKTVWRTSHNEPNPGIIGKYQSVWVNISWVETRQGRIGWTIVRIGWFWT